MKKLLLLLICTIIGNTLHAQTGHFFSSDRFSSSLISDICQDHDGSIWVSTDYGLNRFDGFQVSSFLHDDADSTSLCVNVVSCLLCDSKGNVWVGTNRGLDRFDSNRGAFVHYAFPDNIVPRVSSIIERSNGELIVGTAGYGLYALRNGALTRISEQVGGFYSRIFEDSNGRLWTSGFDVIIRMSSDIQQPKEFHSTKGVPIGYVENGDEMLVLCMHGLLSYRNSELSDANVDMSAVADRDVVFTSIVAGTDGRIYVGTRGRGVFRLSPGTPRRLEPVTIDAFGVDAATTHIKTMRFDRQGNLWLGCYWKGVLMVPLRPLPFRSWNFSAQGFNLGSTISSVCSGDHGMIWCTMQGVGVYGFNAEGHVVAHPSAPDAVEFIFRDHQKNYWIGTDDGLFAYDPLTGRSSLKVKYDCDRFNDMTSDDDGRIYISAFSQGFCVYDTKTGSLLNHNMYETDTVKGRLCNNWILGLSPDQEGLIWMATASGVSCYDPKNDSFRSQGWNVLLDGMVCFDVCELRGGTSPDGQSLKGCMAIGTEQGLFLYDRKTHTVERFPNSDVLSNKVISYIVQSNDGDIWCSTSMGIWQYQFSSQSFIGHVNGNGLTRSEYLYGVGMHTDDDLICFGHNDGVTVFSPSEVKDLQPLLDPLKLTAFIVGDQSVRAGTVLNGVKVTDRSAINSDYFTLSYLDHTITLAFSQFNFENPRNLMLEYKVGDSQWLQIPEGVNNFTLSHLRPSTYRICVRAKVGSNYTPEKVVVVTVQAPWYRSLTAYFIYALLLIALLVYAVTTYRRRANEQMNEEKMKFLINATHDIRSPLTLILGPLEKMKRVLKNVAASQTSEPDSPAASGEQVPTADLLSSIDVIDHNAQRILNLVNQILDVRKIDKQQMHLHCQPTDLVAFTQSIFKMFEFTAKERNINYLFTPPLGELNVWIDRNQFDKVISNLLSNAFKYGNDGGTIELRLSNEDNKAVIQVLDTGAGLDSDNLKHIFERFYQGSNSRRLHINGTGIGLNLCKMIVDMHHGKIEASNRTDGITGSVFTVSIPLGSAHLSEEEKETVAEEMSVAEAKPAVINAPAPAGVSSSQRRYRVLIVDDDVEITKYVSTELGRYYKFGIASNGKDGLKELLTRNQTEGLSDYDAVISDVMMPEMDGFSMLRMIKTNVNISHIPVVMLTSKADVGNRLEGLERGADAFLAKPFDMEELHMVIENLIHNRQRLKGKYSGAQQQADKIDQPEVKGNDELLMERIMKAINKNLSDSDFNVDMLTQEVGISRAQLHRKMKELTGISTSEFIRNIRLEQAARLLKEQKINVTQVAYTVGFSNLAHFSTVFRKHFGVSPSEYVENEG